MTEERKKMKVEVKDKRHTARGDDDGSSGAAPTPPSSTEAHDYLGDLQRVQAEFENYRKRMMREQAEISTRTTAGIVEKLLPVLDNFERAISHGEGGEGVALVYKELKAVLGDRDYNRMAHHITVYAWSDKNVVNPVPLSVTTLGAYPVNYNEKISLYRYGRSRSASGNVIVNLLPRPGALSTSTSPPSGTGSWRGPGPTRRTSACRPAPSSAAPPPAGTCQPSPFSAAAWRMRAAASAPARVSEDWPFSGVKAST